MINLPVAELVFQYLITVLEEHDNCPLTLVPFLDFFFMSVSIVSGQEGK